MSGCYISIAGLDKFPDPTMQQVSKEWFDYCVLGKRWGTASLDIVTIKRVVDAPFGKLHQKFLVYDD